MTVSKELIDSFARGKRLRAELLGWSVDYERGVVTFFVPENEPLFGFPARIGGLDVELIPLPRSKALAEGR